MSYLSRRLASGERVVLTGEYHWVQKTLPWLALLVLGVLVIGVVMWAVGLFRMATTKWAVTNRRVLLKRGFFKIGIDELTLESIEGAHVDQSLFGRMLGYGKLRIRGRGDTEIQFPTMAHPNRFRSAIEDARIRAEARPVEVVPATRAAAIQMPPPVGRGHGERRPTIH